MEEVESVNGSYIGSTDMPTEPSYSPSMPRFEDDEDLHFLTSHQKLLVDQMREFVAARCKDPIPPFLELCGDLRLYRFIEGYNGDITSATDAYITMMQWRSDNGLDAIRTFLVDNWNDDLREIDVPNMKVILQYMPMRLNWCWSMEGHLVTIEFTGCADPVALLNEVSVLEFTGFEIIKMEHKSILMDRRSRLIGKMVKIVSLRDMSGLGFRHLTQSNISLMRIVIKIMSSAYPEVMQNIIIVRAPWLFSTLWHAIKPMLSPRTIEKVQIFGVKDDSVSTILSLIATEDVPVRYGGLKKDDRITDCSTNDFSTNLRSPLIDYPVRAPDEDEEGNPLEVSEVIHNQQRTISVMNGSEHQVTITTNQNALEEKRSEILEENDSVPRPPSRSTSMQLFCMAQASEDDGSGSQFSVRVDSPTGFVENDLLILDWSFKVEAFSYTTPEIGFSIVFRYPETILEDRILVPYSRIQDASDSVSGTTTMAIEGYDKGSFLILWDNTFAVGVIPKNITYSIEIRKPPLKKKQLHEGVVDGQHESLQAEETKHEVPQSGHASSKLAKVGCWVTLVKKIGLAKFSCIKSK